MKMIGKLKAWYWRHWETFEIVRDLITSRGAKFVFVMFGSLFGWIFGSKVLVETTFGINLVGNHPIVEVWYVTSIIGFLAGIFTMIILDEVKK